MIIRIFVLLLLIIVVPDVYLYYMHRQHRRRYPWWKTCLAFLPAVAMCLYTLVLSASRDFAPDNVSLLNWYLLLLGVLVIPKSVFAICHFLGWAHCRYHHTQTNYGVHVGALLAVLIAFTTVYGSTLGFRKVVVRHETFYSKDLPAAFDGYRIAHLSDLHIGTFSGSLVNILEREVDTVCALKPDLITFTGDIQNMRPTELDSVEHILRRLKAKDGIVSILGNHDYSVYVDAPEWQKEAYEQEVCERERGYGWTLLRNESTVIHRGQDSIVIAGMENDSRPAAAQRGFLERTLAGVSDKSFTVMLQHDPSSWRKKILPKSRAQLTLSGHTHAMQFEVLGWSPASLIYSEWGGMYREGHRALNVSKGMGGFIPFRIGASNEIIIITLRRG